jgi:hypothetical protein
MCIAVYRNDRQIKKTEIFVVSRLRTPEPVGRLLLMLM